MSSARIDAWAQAQIVAYDNAGLRAEGDCQKGYEDGWQGPKIEDCAEDDRQGEEHGSAENAAWTDVMCVLDLRHRNVS